MLNTKIHKSSKFSKTGDIDIIELNEMESIKPEIINNESIDDELIRIIIQKITNIIKNDDRILLVFEHNVCKDSIIDTLKSYVEYLNMYEFDIHKLIIPSWLPITIKVMILEMLSEEQFISIIHDQLLMQEVLPYINDKLFMIIIFTFIDSLILPILFNAPSFLTDSRIKSLIDNGADFCGLEYRHLIANRIDSRDPLSVQRLTPNICPKSAHGIKLVLNSLRFYVTESVYKSLEEKMTDLITNQDQDQYQDQTHLTELSITLDDDKIKNDNLTRTNSNVPSKIGTTHWARWALWDVPISAVSVVTEVVSNTVSVFK